MKQILIYTLSCPTTGAVKYVGKTNNFQLRYNQHATDTRQQSPVKSWIKSLRSVGLMPIMEVIDECDSDNWRTFESYWIWQFKAWGFKLKNILEGGTGMGSMPQEVRNKISVALTGKKLTWDAKAVLGKKVCQYDLNGEYIMTYDCIIDAQRLHGFINNNIVSAIKRKQSSYGYQWRYLTPNYADPIGKYIRTPNKPELASGSRKLQIEEIDKEGKVLGAYASIREAKDILCIDNIGAVCRGVRPHAQNRIFRLAIDKNATP